MLVCNVFLGIVCVRPNNVSANDALCVVGDWPFGSLSNRLLRLPKDVAIVLALFE